MKSLTSLHRLPGDRRRSIPPLVEFVSFKFHQISDRFIRRFTAARGTRSATTLIIHSPLDTTYKSRPEGSASGRGGSRSRATARTAALVASRSAPAPGVDPGNATLVIATETCPHESPVG